MVDRHVTKLLQSGVLSANLVEPSDENAEIGFAGVVARSVLVLLGVVILLTTGQWHVLAQFVPGIHSPRRAHRRGQNRANGECSRVAVLQVVGVDVRGVDEEIGSIPSRGLCGHLGEEFLQLPFRVAPHEVGISLLESHLGQGLHHFRSGECLRQEDDPGMTATHGRHEPGPEIDRLGVRIVHPEDRHAVGDPEFQDAHALVVDAFWVVVEVDGVDVLVLLRRILRIGDGAIHSGGEPLRVLMHPWMVRGGLQGEVQGDLKPQGMGMCHEVVEVIEGAQVRVDRVMATVWRADGPR